MDYINRYENGGLKQLISISIPLMISGLSGHVMIFVNRWILSNYSKDAMASVAAAGLVSYVFILAVSSVAAMSEIFVGQYNGAKEYKKTSGPVWQMIWFAIGSSLIIYPITFLGGKFLIPKSLWNEGLPYFYWMMLFIPIYGCSAALSGFFAAIGQPRVISFAAIVSNILNLLLAILLIFGYKKIPAMGAEGAAIATVVGISVQFFILLFVYCSEPIREKYNTLKITWDGNLFFECIKVGYPTSVGHTLELFAWIFIFHVAAIGGHRFVIILTLGQNFLITFVFLTESMQKASLAISSNMIGSGNINKIGKLINSAVKMQFFIIIILALPLLIFPDKLLELFNVNKVNDLDLYKQSILSLFFVWLYFVFDGIVWVISGVLTSAGDTKFIMVTNATCAWLFGVLPTLIAIKYFSIEPYYLWMNTSLYGLINLIIFILRYKFGNWKKLILREKAL
jgi:MATE family multidrug resistance protein